MRERKVTLRERERAEALQAELNEKDAKLAEYERKEHFSSVDEEIAKAREKMKEARASGDVDAEALAIEELSSTRTT